MFRECFWSLTLLFFIVIFISAVNTSRDYDTYARGGDTTPGPEPEEEWHMDFVPTGYLPDSVYRELAWYGILQIQPLYFSSKFKVAARWIWQNTHGRPHVILEDNPQAATSENPPSETLLEESIKWSREQRTAAEVLMENIRTGGNGLTVRTVLSLTMKTSYIIQNGKTFSCEEGSEPDLDAFRQQANVHERKCTFDKEPQYIPIDICMEAEFTPLEYSYVDGWSFCMGDGDRDNAYLEDGDLDCGHKKKVSFKDFLEECAIDNNVVISYEYYGDEPRKDLIHNATICTTWDPCSFSYLYRIEEDEPPELPKTTKDPCDTTICPECEEGYTEETPTVIDSENAEGATRSGRREALKWVSTSVDTFKEHRQQALKASNNNMYVIRARYKNMTIPGKLLKGTEPYISYKGQEIRIDGNFEVAIPTDPNLLKWVAAGAEIYDNAIPAGVGEHGYTTYICRSTVKGHLIPGSYYKEYKACFNSHFAENHKKEFEILVRIE